MKCCLSCHYALCYVPKFISEVRKSNIILLNLYIFENLGGAIYFYNRIMNKRNEMMVKFFLSGLSKKQKLSIYLNKYDFLSS
jgi:hypothetical protein